MGVPSQQLRARLTAELTWRSSRHLRSRAGSLALAVTQLSFSYRLTPLLMDAIRYIAAQPEVSR